MPSPTPPLPFLPIEMKRAILSFCDAPTLFEACLCSLSFLELATPFLYRDIVIHGLQHFERLFYEEKLTSSAPHLNHVFSLSRVQNFTFLGVRNDAFTRSTVPFTTARLSSSSPLRIRRLKVRFGRDDIEDEDEYGETLKAESNPANLYSSMLALFDPEHAIFSSPWDQHRHPFALELESDTWTRVRKWSWSNVVLSDIIFGYPCIARLNFLRALPEGFLTLSFDIRTDKTDGLGFENVGLSELAGGWDEYNSVLACPGIKKVVFHSSSQAQASFTLWRIRRELDLAETGAENRKRMLDKIRFKIDE